jgi:trans-2,3-dihydro-3-hydroxyanthranilate isomerase
MQDSVRRFPFLQLDVFTSRRLEGNPLAVFPDARGLSSEEMQAIARETNLSETTFILPNPEAAPGDPVRVRIFTVQEEVPFAGHPTLGTAAVIRGQSGAAEVRLQLNVGIIPVSFRDDAEGAYGEMRQRDPEFGAIHDREQVAQAVGLQASDIAEDLPIQTVSTGLAFTIVPVKKLETLRNLRLDWGRASDYLRHSDGHFFYFVCRETDDPAARLHARMIFYNGEDPATGSAAGCCTSWAVKYGVLASGEQAIIEQGSECLHPSRIFVRGERQGNRIVNIRVGGHTVEVMRGELFL